MPERSRWVAKYKSHEGMTLADGLAAVISIYDLFLGHFPQQRLEGSHNLPASLAARSRHLMASETQAEVPAKSVLFPK